MHQDGWTKERKVKVREGHWAIQELARGLDIVEVLRDHIVGEHFDYIYILWRELNTIWTWRRWYCSLSITL